MKNRSYIEKMLSDYKLQIKTIVSFKIKEINNAIVLSTKYIAMIFNFSEIIEILSAIVKICRDIRIVNDFSTKIFIHINIIESEKIIINVYTLVSDSCKNMKMNSFAISKNSLINRVTMCIVATTISAYINTKIFIQFRDKARLSNRN